MNLRDMGGYPVNGSITIRKRVLRGDNPNRLTPESVQALIEYGLRTVIDLRHQDEANDPTNPFVPGGLGAAAGVALHSIPLMSQYGSARNYLKHIGLTGSEIDALVARLLA
jgi:hypothetical protein